MSGNEIARNSARGGVLILMGNLASNLLLLVTSLIIARLLQPSGYGTYALALIPPTIFWLFTGLGLNTAIIRFAAYHISRSEVEEAKRISRNSVSFLLLIGGIMSILDFLTAPFISSVVLHRASLTPLVQLSSIGVMGQAFTTAAISMFIGWSKYEYAALTNVTQAITKLFLSFFLILVGFNVYGAVVAHITSYLVVGLSSVLTFSFLNLRSNFRPNKKQTLEDVIRAIRFGLPSHIGTYVYAFAAQNYLVIVLSAIAITTGNADVGFFQAALNVTVVVTVFSTSFSFALLPAFASLEGTQANTARAFSYAVKLESALILPIVVFVIAASHSVILLLYGTAFEQAGNILAILTISYITVVIGSGVVAPYFNGVGRTKLTMILLLSNAGIIFLLAPLLGLVFGIYGLAYTFIIANFVTSVLGLGMAKKYLGSNIHYSSAARILISAGVGYVLLLGISKLSFLSFLPMLIIEVATFSMLYIILLPVTRAIDAEDVSKMMNVIANLGILSRPLLWILKFEGWVIRHIA